MTQLSDLHVTFDGNIGGGANDHGEQAVCIHDCTQFYTNEEASAVFGIEDGSHDNGRR